MFPIKWQIIALQFSHIQASLLREWSRIFEKAHEFLLAPSAENPEPLLRLVTAVQWLRNAPTGFAIDWANLGRITAGIVMMDPSSTYGLSSEVAFNILWELKDQPQAPGVYQSLYEALLRKVGDAVNEERRTMIERMKAVDAKFGSHVLWSRVSEFQGSDLAKQTLQDLGSVSSSNIV
jgi:hypothetical protein